MMRVGILDVCTIPEGYYYIGASVGREWYVDPDNKFKVFIFENLNISFLIYKGSINS